MTHPVEGRTADSPASATPVSAVVIPLRSHQSDLQRAVQERAQENMRLEREREKSSKSSPWIRVVLLGLAAVPVFMTFGSSLAFLSALKEFGAKVSISGGPADEQGQQPVQQEPGVVMLQSFDVQPAASPSSDSQGSSDAR